MTAISRPLVRRTEFLPFSPPFVGEEEIAAVGEAIRAGWITTGPRTKEFELAFAKFVSAPEALALNSCTAALHTALITAGIGRGDEVITTPFTFAASVNVIEHVGARPVLVDVQPDTLNIDPAAIRAALTPRTRAIIPVHYAGHPADLDAIAAIAKQHGLVVVEDAAHAVAARYHGVLIGGHGNPTAFSFYATKNLATGEGGALTAAPDFLTRARMVSLHGMSRDAYRRYQKGGTWRYEILTPGFKYNMTDIQAAMGLVQLTKLPAMQRRRKEIANRYISDLRIHHSFDLPVERSDVEHAWHLFPLRLRLETLRIGRDQFSAELTARNIGHSVHFIPVHVHPYYREKYSYRPEALPVAYRQYQRLLTIPLHPGLTDRDVHDVVAAVVDIADTHAK